MSLASDIEKEIKNSAPKWAILKEEAGEDIFKMIRYAIPLAKQIELILSNKIVDKLDRKEYHNILVKHFNYREKEQLKKEKKTVFVDPPTAEKNKPKPAPKNTGTAENKLSENVDLMSHYLEQQANK